VGVNVEKGRERTIRLRSRVRGKHVKPEFAQFTSIPVFTAGKLAVEGTHNQHC
jgi:hypothetical protein